MHHPSKKTIKIIIYGIVITVVVTIIIRNGKEILELGKDLIYELLPVKDVFNTTNLELVDKLHLIGDPSKCYDMPFLKHIADTEELCNLQKGELFSLIFGENSFTHRTIIEFDKIVSYGCSQIRLSTAKAAQDILQEKGIYLAEPTAKLLSTDHNYVVTLTGRYLEHLHTLHSNPLKVWTAWNCGVEALPRFAARGFHYAYTHNMLENMARFAKILG